MLKIMQWLWTADVTIQSEICLKQWIWIWSRTHRIEHKIVSLLTAYSLFSTNKIYKSVFSLFLTLPQECVVFVKVSVDASYIYEKYEDTKSNQK